MDEIGKEIRAATAAYAMVADPTQRTSLCVQVLHLLEKLPRLEDGVGQVTTRRVEAEELHRDTGLRGSVLMHLDLVSRATVTASEAAFTAARGTVRVAEHSMLPELPVGVLLALPAMGLVKRRSELFDDAGPTMETAEVAMVFALATNPPRLGAGAALLADTAADFSAGGRTPRLVAFSPLTGLRARVIRMVDDEETWATTSGIDDPAERDVVRAELCDLLSQTTMPDIIDESARRWLEAEAREFAASEDYKGGNFHRSRGARLVGFAVGGDRKDSDSMWSRTYFDYGRA